MAPLRKKILHSKIQHILAQNNFVLFFQFNNIKFKEWVLLKNQILNFPETSMIVIKNNITREMLDNHMFTPKYNLNTKCGKKTSFFSSQSKTQFASNSKKNKANYLADLHETNSSSGCENTYSKVDLRNTKEIIINKSITSHLQNNERQLSFLCQGPTLLLGFNSIQQCKIIYDILNKFTYNLPYTKQHSKPEKNIFNFRARKVNSLKDRKLPLIFTNNKLVLNSKKYNLLKQNSEKSSLLFIGGLVQGKIINHLDLEKLSNLNNYAYVNLIQQCYNPIIWFLFLKTIIEIRFVKCFENNLINLLHAHKNTLKK